MNKRTISSIIKIAKTLDSSGYYKEADKVTQTMVKISQNFKELKDLTPEDLIESDRIFAETSKEAQIEKEKRRIGPLYKNLDFLRSRLEGYFTKAREFFIIKKTGKKRNIFQKMIDKRMIDDAVDKFTQLVATKSREEVEKELKNFIRTSGDKFDWEDVDTDIRGSILNLYYHTSEEIANDENLRIARPFALKEE